MCNTNPAQNTLFFLWLNSPFSGALASSFRGFMITHGRHTTLGRTPLDKGPARRRDLYLTTHNTETDIHAPGGIRTHDPSKRAAADPRLRPRGHWDRQLASLREYNLQLTFQS
jgi:hypothetical protein